MKHFAKILFLFSFLILARCTSKKAFTASLKNRSGLDENQLTEIQYYTSDKIVLYQVYEKSNTQVKRGKIITSNKKDAESIIIPKNTPCILVKDLGKTMLLSFEYGEGKVLAFGTVTGGQYSLMAKSWENSQGVLQYAGKSYQTVNGEVYLKVKAKELRKVKRKYRTVKGRKVR